MSLQRFLHFVAVAEEANFGRAAARIGIKQPPLSQSIRRLERDLGVTLLDRGPKGVTLTKAGEAFLPEARAALAAAERAAALARSAASVRTPVRIGVISVALWEALPALLEVAREANIPVRLEQRTTNEQLAVLASGALDLGFLAPPFEAPTRLRMISLASEPIIAAVPSKLVTEDSGTIPLDLIAQQLVLFPRAEGPALYDAILAMFRTRGLTPKVVQESPRMLTTLALVAAGCGASLVPAALTRSISVKGVEFRNIEQTHGVPAWPLAIAHMPLSAGSDAAKLLARWRPSALKRQREPES
jgi:DNA-binding transcriptional LysR family regulator